ncbi:granulocyte colony-stimulating factor receptor-like isoform X1 [Xenopus laevis]|uniref:Granulocyte colony-stimulating factor receptor-like isoform X1 n=2 Tax=Xenopus laevis TaxID=8355 RepID=A0A8J1MEU6_XENLA|nr:granulocyte colony-stimulating factor receptor-like isoform X1 [Xenopus laevis]
MQNCSRARPVIERQLNVTPADIVKVMGQKMWRKWGIMLMEILLLLMSGGVTAKTCGVISIESHTVQLGSPLFASCAVGKQVCPGLNLDAQVIWKLDQNIIPSKDHTDVHQNMSSIYFRSFNKTSAALSCHFRMDQGIQLMDRVEINAGYPPAKPTNLTCHLNLTDERLVCNWQLGSNPLIKTNATLSIAETNKNCTPYEGKKYTCVPRPGETSCAIPRTQYHLYKKHAVWITAQNELGRVISSYLCLTPMNYVKLDPPVIKEAAPLLSHPGCVRIQTKKSETGSFIEQWYQLRYRKAEENQWTETKPIMKDSDELEYCNLSPATRYHFQIRCIRIFMKGYWSEWGSDTSLLTSESAPTGKVKTWWRVLEATGDGPTQIQLLWKALKKEEANSENPWYIVGIRLEPYWNGNVVCNTTFLNCSFHLPHEATGAYLWVYNTAGHSPRMEIDFRDRKIPGMPVSWIHVLPNTDNSLAVEWRLQTMAKSYVLEWRKSSQNLESDFKWKTEPEGSSTSILQDIEPFQQYTVWVYPVYENQVGSPVQVNAYSRQGVPEIAPKLTLISVTKSSAQLSWEPVPLERRHGFIKNYTVFWTDSDRRTLSVTLNSNLTRFVIRNLQPLGMYTVLLSCSTSEGSVNGSVLMIYTTLLDEMEIHVLIMVLCMSSVMIVIGSSFICLGKHKGVKNKFWQVVPDPANSSMGKWRPVCHETPKMSLNIREMITSDLTILEGWPEKKPPSTDVTKCTPVSFEHKPQCSTDDAGVQRPYINVADTVQYAKVITGYFGQSPTSTSHLRSNSTQPLLSNTSPSPQTYENMWFHSNNEEDSIFLIEDENLSNFPLLQALKIQEDGDIFSF